MSQTCQAAVFLSDDRYEVREFAVPDPPPGGAVIKVEAVGLCGSDVAANAVHWTDLADVNEGDTVVIQGPGHQGLAVLEAVLARGPAQVIVTGTSADALRLETAMAIGATHTVMADEVDPVAMVADLTGGKMADVVMDIASAVQTVPLCIDLVRWNGRVLLAGLKHYAPILNLVTDMIVMKALTVRGGSGFTYDSMQRAVAMLESGEARSDLVIGEVFGLDGIEEAMGLLSRTIAGRDAVRVGLAHQ